MTRPCSQPVSYTHLDVYKRQPSYCSTCHDSGAIKVDHYQMLYNHAQSVRDAGATTACAVCHQPSYCDQCYKGDILGPTNSHLDKPGG